MLCFFGFLGFVFLCLCYVEHNEIYNYTIPRMTKHNPVISAMQNTMTSGNNNISDCEQLFGVQSLAHNFSLSHVFQNNINKFLSEINENRIRMMTGHIYMLKLQLKLYHYLTAKLKFVRTVCETGMNDYCINGCIM